jgi:hypothetical protein
MPRRKPAPQSSPYLRRAIAGLAARLMAEDGITDYGAAKRKAARNLGAGDGEALPTNEEVETELRTYLALYQEEEQGERLRELRQAALEVMELLADFRPYLTGAVLDGTAGRYSEVEIELFADSAKDVEISLLSRNISYEIAENRRQGPDAPEARLRLDLEGVPIVVSIYPLQAERHQKRSPHGGKGHARARASAVAALLSD